MTEPVPAAPRSTDARLNDAIRAADALDVRVGQLGREIRANRLWRWWAIIAVSSTAALVVVLIFVISSLDNFHTLIDRSHQQGIANHQLLQIIQSATSPAAQARTQAAIDQAVCEVRDNAALVLHDAFPRVVVTLPATPTCPAYTPS